MGRPILQVAPTVINAMTSASGVSATASTAPTVDTATIALPAKLGGGDSTQVRVTANAANQNVFIITTMSPTLSGKNGFEFWIHVSGLENASTASIAGTGGTGTFSLRNSGGTASMSAVISYHQGWNHIRLGRSDFTSAGGATWATTFVDCAIKWDAMAGITPTFYLRDISYSGYSRPQIAIVCDDGYQTIKDTLEPILTTYGFVGTIGVIGSLVGSSGKMSLATLNGLHDAGWAMVNHSYTHAAQTGSPASFLWTADQATCYSEISQNKAYLEAQGWTRDGENLDYIAPYGEWSAAYNAARIQAGCRSFWGLGSSDYVSAPSKPSFSDRAVDEPFTNRLSLVSGVTGANITGCLDRAIAAGRSCVVLAHSVVTSPGTSLEVSTASMTTLAQYLHRMRAMIDVVTLPQLYLNCVDPAV